MLVRKRPWVFVYLCCVPVCYGDYISEFARACPSVDASVKTLFELCVCECVSVCVCPMWLLVR